MTITKRTGHGKLNQFSMNVVCSPGGAKVPAMASHSKRQSIWSPVVSSACKERIGKLKLQRNQS